jgi:hypothetical protein
MSKVNYFKQEGLDQLFVQGAECTSYTSVLLVGGKGKGNVVTL